MQVGLLRMARPTGGRGGDASCRPEPNNIQCVYIYICLLKDDHVAWDYPG